MNDEHNPEYALQSISATILAAVARGEVDLNALAKKELAQRGLNHQGRWVGFQKAALEAK